MIYEIYWFFWCFFWFPIWNCFSKFWVGFNQPGRCLALLLLCFLHTKVIKQKQVQPCSLVFVGRHHGKLQVFINGNENTSRRIEGVGTWQLDELLNCIQLPWNPWESAHILLWVLLGGLGCTAVAGEGGSGGVGLLQSKQERSGGW